MFQEIFDQVLVLFSKNIFIICVIFPVTLLNDFTFHSAVFTWVWKSVFEAGILYAGSSKLIHSYVELLIFVICYEISAVFLLSCLIHVLETYQMKNIWRIKRILYINLIVLSSRLLSYIINVHASKFSNKILHLFL